MLYYIILFIGCLHYLSVHFHSCSFYIQYHVSIRELTPCQCRYFVFNCVLYYQHDEETLQKRSQLAPPILPRQSTICRYVSERKNRHPTKWRQKGIQEEVLWVKGKEWKRVPTETEYLTIENVEKVSSIRQWKRGTTLIVGDSVLAGIGQKCISGNRNVKVRIFPSGTTHDMHDCPKPLLKKNSDNIILHIGTNNSVNETSWIFWMEYYL